MKGILGWIFDFIMIFLGLTCIFSIVDPGVPHNKLLNVLLLFLGVVCIRIGK